MDLFEYAKGVKTFKKSELVMKLTTLTVAANDLLANLERLEANKIDLGHVANQWAITKSVIRALEQSGYRGVQFNHAIKADAQCIVALVPGLTKMVQGFKGEVWDGKLLTLRQANLLNLLEHIEHWLRYTNTVYSVLLSLNNKKVSSGDSALDKADLKMVNGTLEFYKGTTQTLMKGARTILAGLEAVPDVEISETSIAVLEGTKEGFNADLLKQGFGVHQINPIYWYSLGKMNLNIARIEKMRRDNELFAGKISQAVNLKNGVNDAELDARIEEYQNEIIKNVNTIEMIERQYD